MSDAGLDASTVHDRSNDALAPFAGIVGRSSTDYLLRTLQQNQMHLITLADHKAGLVLTVSLLMVTFSASRLGTESATPTVLVLLAGALLAALLAVMSLLPNLSSAKRSTSATEIKNPLFFGSIASMSADAYGRRLAEVLHTDADTYRAISVDVHAIARVLTRKYGWLRYSYLALLVTLPISAATTLAFYLY